MKKVLLAAVVLAVLASPALGDGEQTPLFNLWADLSFQSWVLQGAPMPQPLVTTGPLPAGPGGFAPQFGAGVLGQPGTEVAFGDSRLQQTFNQGARLTVGAWLDYPTETWAVEASFLYLSPQSQSTFLGSDALGFPLLARPVIDAGTNTETVLFVSAPGAFSGGIGITSTTSLWGAEGNLLYVADRGDFMGGCGYCNLLAGFRYLDLHDELDIAQSTQVLPEGVAFLNANPGISPTRLSIDDNFSTRNDFYGAQVGAQLGYTFWRFNASLAGKLALGGVHQEVDVSGSTTVSSYLLSKPATSPGGLLALPSNIGTHQRNIVAVLPTMEANLMFEVTSQIHLMVGYQVLYLSDVLRPGDQIDREVNRDQLPTSQLYNPSLGGPARPGVLFNGSDFWAQGLTLGISFWF
jgi:hypothetical protein